MSSILPSSLARASSCKPIRPSTVQGQERHVSQARPSVARRMLKSAQTSSSEFLSPCIAEPISSTDQLWGHSQRVLEGTVLYPLLEEDKQWVHPHTSYALQQDSSARLIQTAPEPLRDSTTSSSSFPRVVEDNVFCQV